MSQVFWQAKIWGLLHDPLLKSLYRNKDQEGIWEEVLQYLGNSNPTILKNQVKNADYIAAASDRPAWDQDNNRGFVDYQYATGLHISHLLSGEPHYAVIQGRRDAHPEQDVELRKKESQIVRDNLFPLLEGLTTEEQHQKAFWWLWRCLPVAIAKEFGDEIALLPADTRIPDCSIWSHNNSVSALAGSLVGLEQNQESRPYLVIFTMTPVQEMIKASRKMQDFWAGSWLLHYLSAKICWKWAQKYGPDSLVYPSLYAQPLIDQWLVKSWADFSDWVTEPLQKGFHKKLLTAGFPNVLVAVLPANVVHSGKGAIACAEGILRESWMELGNKVWEKLKQEFPAAETVSKEGLWDEWLKHHWQTYWTAVPLGNNSKIPEEGADALVRGQGQILTEQDKVNEQKIQQTRKFKQDFLGWVNAQNSFCQTHHFKISDQFINPENLVWNSSVFKDKVTCPTLAELSTYKQFNVGLWWAYIFDQLRHNLSGVKNARSWELPSVFSPRSTVSGIGPVLHSQQFSGKTSKPVDWVSEFETRQFWEQEQGWFSGQEQLNPAEVLKRGLEKILADPDVLGIDEQITSYPDLTAGVAGYLKVRGHLPVKEKSEVTHRQHFEAACDRVLQISWTSEAIRPVRGKWGIPYMDDDRSPKKYHPRLIHAGWLAEDAVTDEISTLQQQVKQAKQNKERLKQEGQEGYQTNLTQDNKVIDNLLREVRKLKVACRSDLQRKISCFYPQNNPSDWYVLAVGDGDDMGEWLKGSKLEAYQIYMPKDYPSAEARAKWEGVEAFLQQTKRMGPATHAALSRALLDFSNQLVPYITEQRYAGRLIYSGGDDVLAYTNLWEWDSWLWDVRQCFKGSKDPHHEFDHQGDYWRWKREEKGRPPDNVSSRPLFTMGRNASISFGLVIAHHSVPLAIALENLWDAEEKAKEHQYFSGCFLKGSCCSIENQEVHYRPSWSKKDAVQMRVLYGNGNSLKATSKFDVFDQWRSLLNFKQTHSQVDFDPALFEQAAEVWQQHPAPVLENSPDCFAAIVPWTMAFCDRRELFKGEDKQTAKQDFQTALAEYLKAICQTTQPKERDREVQSWLKLAAFVLRKRDIRIGGIES